jgi:predicted SAM-dependent methyltransferase
MIKKSFEHFKNRNGRATFILNRFKEYIEESSTILDVGCDNNILKQNLQNKKVIGIDIGGNPDFTIDLDKDKLTRFTNNSFDMVICTEVLEHLNDFHSMLNELFRVSNKYVLISLPNCMDVFTKYNFLFHNKISKYYGLPLEKTNDRHKWIFFWNDIDNFFKAYCKKNNLGIIDKFLHFNFSQSIKGFIARSAVKILNLNSASQSYWIIISKK